MGGDGHNVPIEQKTYGEWMPEMGHSSPAEIAMMLNYCHEWTHSQQMQESELQSSLWQAEATRQHNEFTMQDRPMCAEIGQDDPVSEPDREDKVLESPRTPKQMFGFARSPNLTSSQQQSLPATPQPRGWVPETPSPGPRTSVHWGPLLLHGPAPLPPLVLWES